MRTSQGNVTDNSTGNIFAKDMGVARRGPFPHPFQSFLDKNKDLGNYDKHLSLRDCFLAGLLISGLTKEKYNTTLHFALTRVVMA